MYNNGILNNIKMIIMNNIRNVVLVNQSTGYLMIDIVNAYTESYENVVLIAGTVKTLERKLFSHVKVSRIISYNRKSTLTRLATWLIATLQIWMLILIKYRDYHVIYVTNPPLSYFVSLFLKNTYSIIVYDIYPDALKNIKIENLNVIFKIWSWINRKIFKNACCIYTLSSGMKKLLLNYCEKEKIKVIPNWSGSTQLKPINKWNNPFVNSYNLMDKFVVMYSGNIGRTHNVEIMMELAIRLRAELDINFFIIGEGFKKNDLMKIANEYNLKSCHFLTWQPSNKICYSLAAADISIVTLTEDAANISVPSKTYNLLAIGSPLLCIAPERSEIGRLVKNTNCGMCFMKEQIDEMVAYILKLKNNKEYKEQLSYNALVASNDYTYKNAHLYVTKQC